MNKELNLYNKTYLNDVKMSGGGNKDKNEDSDIDIIRKYRKRCLELNKENKELKQEIVKLKKDLEKKI